MRLIGIKAAVAAAVVALAAATPASAQRHYGGGGYRGGWGGYYGRGGYYPGSYGWGGSGIGVYVGPRYSYYPRYGYDGYYGYPGYSYSYPSYYSYPSTYSSDVVTYGTPASTEIRSFYPPDPVAPTNQARVHVRCPAGAELWFDGTATEQRGNDRMFSTPTLEQGKNYTYEVKARWMDNGKPVERTKVVSVRAGQTTDVDFMTSGT